jgi:isopenicillin N synthase-like dioxygenase
MAYADARPVDAREVPIIDLASLVAGTSGAAAAIGREIDRAATNLGFFYVLNHGVAPATIAAANDVARRFFSLPLEEKRRSAVNRLHRGYIEPGEARMYGRARPDLKESFIIGLELDEADPDVRAGKPLMGPNRWPENPPEFHRALSAFYAAMCRCGGRLMQAVAAALGLPQGAFDAAFAKPLARGSVIHYPPQPPELGAEQFGVAPHSDYGCLTLLWQDTVGGLQIRDRQGEWLAAPPVEGTLVINIGDLLARWTNDRYASTPHRVINASGRARSSMAVFFDPHPDTDVSVLDVCCSPDNPARYPPTSCGAYLLRRFDEAFRYRRS